MRPIDADALMERYGEPCHSFADVIEAMPTLDYAPVKRGEWVTKPDGYIPADIHCSECGKKYNFFVNPNYCPNCGALMKEDGK